MNTADEKAAERLAEVVASPYFEVVMSKWFAAYEAIILAEIAES